MTSSDLPPAYNSIHNSTANIAMPNESEPNCDDVSELITNNCFDDKTTRIGFLQKVLAIKLLQTLLMVLIFGIFAACNYDIRMTMRHGAEVHFILLSTLIFLAITGLLIYCTKARRENPYRYIFLIFHPISLALFVSFPATILYILSSIALAFLTYVFALFSVLLYSVFALQTKLPFAAKHAMFLACLVQILIYAFIVPFVWGVNAFAILYISLALSLDLIYILWDLETMTSKKYWHDITPDNFVDGALNLQLDYYYMFVNIMMPQIRKGVETNEQC
ncbi:uncharacterized protein LOC125231676 isoform X3 [Leguminivora glycinivorella]|uniref:uncharacterized protein LOC125231676 isoform X2 n=1 Tax=Leguminivora glycinivorella TaxID=1035111 RepID=UPI00200C039B|nr:uncharacterized protein LOC125231676 isoform X2 [Leguminivora glycinivorella]XP_047993146.1 uncharacterized protein LOC125231676 isoform X3 [Leguminivora glycinivorella]